MFRKKFFDVHLYFEVIKREKRPTGTLLTGIIMLMIAVGGRVLFKEFEKFLGALSPWITAVTLTTAIVSFYAYSRYQTIPDLVHGWIPHFERPVIIYDDDDESFDNHRIIYKDDPAYNSWDVVPANGEDEESTFKYEFIPSIADRHSERKEY